MCGERSAMDVMTSRQSCRKYSSKPVTKDQLEQIVNAGRLAATARNLQPWHFVVVTDPSTRRAIADITEHGKFIADAPACIVVLCEDTRYYLEDGCAATQNVLNAATALELGCCWVAGDKKPYADQIVGLVGAPVGKVKLIALVPVGHPAEQSTRATKKDLNQVLHWERY
jgi:nitroreductase